MPQFPKLASGAVCQYPVALSSHYSNRVLTFLDGSEQRYRLVARRRLGWVIDLAKLGPADAAAIQTFFDAQQGEKGVFSFTDPISGTTYDSCRFESPVTEVQAEQDNDHRLRIEIYESHG